VGSWTGTAAQNVGKSNYTVVMTITSTGAETNYPELNCGGKLKRVGSANGYVFFLETITHGGKSSGGSCINGAVTVTLDGANLAWGWVGSDGGSLCRVEQPSSEVSLPRANFARQTVSTAMEMRG
jgi:hypothetical protein